MTNDEVIEGFRAILAGWTAELREWAGLNGFLGDVDAPTRILTSDDTVSHHDSYGDQDDSVRDRQ